MATWPHQNLYSIARVSVYAGGNAGTCLRRVRPQDSARISKVEIAKSLYGHAAHGYVSVQRNHIDGAASTLVLNKKERKRFTLNRDFLGDYLDLMSKPYLRNLIGTQTRYDTADTVQVVIKMCCFATRSKSMIADLIRKSAAFLLRMLDCFSSGRKRSRADQTRAKSKLSSSDTFPSRRLRPFP